MHVRAREASDGMRDYKCPLILASVYHVHSDSYGIRGAHTCDAWVIACRHYGDKQVKRLSRYIDSASALQLTLQFRKRGGQEGRVKSPLERLIAPIAH